MVRRIESIKGLRNKDIYNKLFYPSFILDKKRLINEEVSYQTYLSMKNKHRIIKHLEAQYFVEKEKQ